MGNSILIDNHVRFYRRQNNLSQKALGKIIDKSDRFVSNMENYLFDPKLSLCVELASIFGLEVGELFFEKGKAPEKRIVYMKK